MFTGTVDHDTVDAALELAGRALAEEQVAAIDGRHSDRRLFGSFLARETG